VRFSILIVFLMVPVNAISLYAQNTPDATVVSLKGKAFVRVGKDGAPRSLKKGDKLFSGQQVKCEKGCVELQISYCNVTRPIVNRSKWTTILSINCGAAKRPRGGAPKGSGVTFISPRESEVIRPEAFSLRWEQTGQASKINIVLKINLGEEIWSRKDVVSSTGFFESDDIEEKLKEAQKAGELSLLLVVDEGKGKEPERIKFRLISFEDQQELSKRLVRFEDEPEEVLRHLGRGLTFSTFALYTEGALELERALDLLRNQHADLNSLNALTRLAIMTNYQAYNDERVKQLCAALKRPGSLPLECSQIIK
jgi:hypothetical protein